MTVFEVIFNYIGIDFYSSSTPIIAISVFTALGVGLIASVLPGLAYYSNISALLLFAKPVERKDDIKRTPSGLINRCVVEYMACGENGAPLLSVDSIVMKHIYRMSFLGVNFKALERLYKSVDYALLGIMASASFVTGEVGWIVFSGGTWLIYKIVLLFFDAETLREKLFYGISTYINREIGKFYIADDKAGLRIFKNEVHSSLMEQASILQNAINNLTRELTGIIKTSYVELEATLGKDINKYDDVGERLRKPVESMQALFGKFSESAEALNRSSSKLYESISLLEEKLGTITSALEKNSAANTKNIENSEIIFKELRDTLKSFSVAYSALEAELSAVKSAQSAMSLSLQSYELSLQQTVNRVGEALGSVVEYSGKEAAESLNEAISSHVRQFQNDSARLIEKMTVLFEQSYEQNKSEIKALLRIEESLKSAD